MTKTSFWIISGIATAVIGFTFYSYWSQFNQSGLSRSREVWGQFGDFIGGVSNSILSFLTLFLTGYIAYRVSESEREREDREKRRHLFDLQFSEFKSLLDIISRVNETPTLSRQQAIPVFFSAEMSVISFTSSNSFLFPFLNDKDNVCKILEERIKSVRMLYIAQEKSPIILTPEMNTTVQEYWNAATDVRKVFQDFLRGQLE